MGLKTATGCRRQRLGAGENDEFVQPSVTGAGTVNDGDAIIMYNFRPDRAREITRAFADPCF